MKILTALTYYTPHVSGLTVYARRVVAAMVARGHQVTVLTSHYDHNLPREEVIDGARVVRLPVMLRFSKGVLMPTLPWRALRLAISHDLVYLHTPQMEASLIAVIARLVRRPVITSHQCDILLPSRLLRLLFWPPIAASHRLTAMLSHQIVALSKDYADSSRFLGRYKQKLLTIHPPVPIIDPDNGDPLDLRGRYVPADSKVVGFVGRFAEDKGVAYLIDAVPHVLARFPDARFVFVGEREKVIGERVWQRLRGKINALGEHIVLLDVLPDRQLAEFYRDCDVVVLPSINSTEAFGMVQVEAMGQGTPVVATDLPGVRVAVQTTQMGEVVPPQDARALGQAIVRVLEAPLRYAISPERVAQLFDPEKTYDFYEDLFAAALGIDPWEVEESATARESR